MSLSNENQWQMKEGHSIIQTCTLRLYLSIYYGFIFLTQSIFKGCSYVCVVCTFYTKKIALIWINNFMQYNGYIYRINLYWLVSFNVLYYKLKSKSAFFPIIKVFLDM